MATRGRAPATRGVRWPPRGGSALSWSATETSVSELIQFFRKRDGCLTTSFHEDQTSNPWLLRANILNRNGRPMYQLQLLLKNHALIRNLNRVISSPSWAISTVSETDRAKSPKCRKQWNLGSCELISTMLGAKPVYDPKIKVVPLAKYYNFALVTTSMQGL